MKAFNELKLPDTLGETLRVAIDDLKAAEKQKDYTVDMENWHSKVCHPGDEHIIKCSVCLAGSVIARSVGYDSFMEINDIDINDHLERDKFAAINELRTGNVMGAALMLYGDIAFYFGGSTDLLRDLTESYKDKIDYHKNREYFFESLEHICGWLLAKEI